MRKQIEKLKEPSIKCINLCIVELANLINKLTSTVNKFYLLNYLNLIIIFLILLATSKKNSTNN